MVHNKVTCLQYVWSRQFLIVNPEGRVSACVVNMVWTVPRGMSVAAMDVDTSVTDR